MSNPISIKYSPESGLSVTLDGKPLENVDQLNIYWDKSTPKCSITFSNLSIDIEEFLPSGMLRRLQEQGELP